MLHKFGALHAFFLVTLLVLGLEHVRHPGQLHFGFLNLMYFRLSIKMDVGFLLGSAEKSFEAGVTVNVRAGGWVNDLALPFLLDLLILQILLDECIWLDLIQYELDHDLQLHWLTGV
jgi:hypothetical protein